MRQTPDAAAVDEASSGSSLSRVKDRARDLAHAAARPLVRALARTGAEPDHLTVLGFVVSAAAALAYFEGAFAIGSGLLVLSGVCDVLDGELARETGVVSKFGAFLDSTLDRIADGVVFVGIAGFYLANLVELAQSPRRVLEEMSRGLEPRTWAVVALTAIVALLGSFMVSYTRARAEGLGLECRVGWFERPERMVLLIAAGFFGVGPVMPGALLLLAVLSFVTAGQRIHHVHTLTRTRSPGAKR